MTQFNAPTYDIERPTGQCAFTGEDLRPGDPYVATLVELDEQERAAAVAAGKNPAAVIGLKRLDFGWAAWQGGRRPDHIFSFWKATVPDRHVKRKLFVDDDVLMNLFRRLADEDDPQRVAFRFVLGLILMRKKYLRYDGTQRRTVTDEGGSSGGSSSQQDWWQVTPKLDLSKGPLGKWNEEDRLEMVDPHLDEQQIQQVTQQIGEILEAEL